MGTGLLLLGDINENDSSVYVEMNWIANRHQEAEYRVQAPH